MAEKFTRQDQLASVREAKESGQDFKNIEIEVEVKKAILNPELIKNLSFSQLANFLNKAGCNDYEVHPLKDIIDAIINERYPYSDGWSAYEGGAGYIDS